jgi:multiple sugar transport system permease protein
VSPRSIFSRLNVLLQKEEFFAYTLIAPALIILTIFVAYPFILGIWLSLSDRLVGVPGHFVGLKNFTHSIGSQIFRRTVSNTFIYTGVTVVFKMVLGIGIALVLNRHFPLKRFVRATVLLPWIIPTALSTLAWFWMYDAPFSIINWTLRHLGLIRLNIQWLGKPVLAMTSVIIVNIWRGTPFFSISFLAGLQTISPELGEAADIDGAGAWTKFWHITLPLLKPVIVVVVLFSLIMTFADFQLVYVLTRGGPANSTHLFATLSYQVALGAGRLGEGAAIALFMFPVLFMIVVVQLLYIRKGED